MHISPSAGMPAPQAGYAPQAYGMPAPQAGYAPQAYGMPAPQAGYAPQAYGMPAPQAGYAPQAYGASSPNQDPMKQMFKAFMAMFFKTMMGSKEGTTDGYNPMSQNIPKAPMGYPSTAAYAPTTKASAPASAPASGSSGMENSILNQINSYRQTKGLPPLVADPQLSVAARSRSGDQAQKQKMSHDGFQESVKDLGLRGSAENVAMNKGMGDPASQSVEGWIKSPGHHKNLTGDYTKTGIGVVQGSDGAYYFTQLFGK
jgi:uncharacterized protein YkwD